MAILDGTHWDIRLTEVNEVDTDRSSAIELLGVITSKLG